MGYPLPFAVVTVALLHATAALAAPPSGLSFVDATETVGLRYLTFAGPRGQWISEDMGSGVAVGDVDGDGDGDVYVVATNALARFARRQPLQRNRLFLNDGKGKFTPAPEDAAAFRGVGMGALFCDLDGDADLDLVVANFGPDRIFFNDGKGRFSDQTRKSSLGDPAFSASYSCGDLDGDTDLDLYQSRYVRFDPRLGPPPPKATTPLTAPTQALLRKEDLLYVTPPPYGILPINFYPLTNGFWRNDGAGRFSEHGEETGTADPEGRSLQSLIFDLSGDGRADILVANDVSDNRFFASTKGGTFVDASGPTGLLDGRGAMGMAMADFDGDGRLDLFISNYSTDSDSLALQRKRTDGSVHFVPWERSGGIADSSVGAVGWGVSTADFDLDGWPDLFVARGHIRNLRADPQRLGAQKDGLYHNQGDGTFRPGDLGPARVSRGAVSADLDGDGDEDLLVVDQVTGLRYLRNTQRSGHHFLKVRLRGQGKNPYGVGARIRIRSAGRWQVRPMLAGHSYLSSGPMEVVFGLGKATSVDDLEVVWPGGEKSRHRVDGVDRTLTLSQP